MDKGTVMKHFIVFSILAIFLVIAMRVFGLNILGNSKETQKPKYPKGVEGITVFEGCEYLNHRTYVGRMVHTHKGNCTNSIHIYKVKETE